MNEIKFACPHCDQHLQAAESLGGRQFQCPGCNHHIRVPTPFGKEDQTAFKPETGHTWDTFVMAKVIK